MKPIIIYANNKTQKFDNPIPIRKFGVRGLKASTNFNGIIYKVFIINVHSEGTIRGNKDYLSQVYYSEKDVFIMGEVGSINKVKIIRILPLNIVQIDLELYKWLGLDL